MPDAGQPSAIAADGNENWNFTAFLAQGTFVNVSAQLTNPAILLPFLYLAAGAPVFLAGLILPIVTVSFLAAQLVAAPILSGGMARKWFMTLSLMTMALALSIAGFASTQSGAGGIAVLFLLVAAVVGTTQGTLGLAFNDLLGRIMPPHRRDSVLFIPAGLAGALTAAVALISHLDIGTATSLEKHLELLWVGIGMTVVAGLLTLLIREPCWSAWDTDDRQQNVKVPTYGKIGSMIGQLKPALGLRWYRRYLMARILLLPIVFGIPFFAIHAATLHADHRHSFCLLLLTSGLGNMAGGAIWRRVSTVSVSAVMGIASFVACAAGLLAIAIDTLAGAQSYWLTGAVFFLVTIATQGVRNAYNLYLVNLTTHEERPYFISITNVAMAVAGAVVSFALGVLAHVHGVIWPILIIVGLNVAAGLYATQLEKPQSTKAVCG